MQSVVLVGNPNVGKSVLFYHLTGNYVTVSNYPGTTVEVSSGRANLSGRNFTVYDTPGLYSFSPITEEEAVTRRLLMQMRPDLVIHVTDAKNLPRMLPLTLELLNAGFQVILVLNMIDEAEKLGVRIHKAELAKRLGIPVLETALTQGRGIHALKKELARQAVSAEKRTPHQSAAFSQGLDTAETAQQRYRDAETILAGIFTLPDCTYRLGWFDSLTLHPVGGLLLTLLVLYAGLYLFVGRFGAGYLVDLLEGTLLGEIVIPYLKNWLQVIIPWPAVLDIVTGDFGLLTMGFRYAFGIILPIVGTYFFAFAFLEDSGYLPRLSYWADAAMKKIGLNGRAIIPVTLGLGCGTMAVLVTRTLESRRERIIATFLLALAVPCSAQLGLILALLSAEPLYLAVWIVVVGAMFIGCGALLNLLLSGRHADFFMELPPVRLPKLNAILQKTLARMRWYFAEVIPVFIGVSIILWLLGQTGLLVRLNGLVAPLVGKMGLPPAMSTVFLYGFFRRDYGAAGLWDLYRAGVVSGAQIVISATVLTLFLPCLAQLAMMIRERGLFVALIIAVCISGLACLAGLAMRILFGLPAL